MPESEYNALVRKAAATWPLIVRVLRRRYPKAPCAVVEDCAIEAIELFSDPKNFEKILHPEQPLPWLSKTAEYLYRHELRKMGRFLHFQELGAELEISDKGIERLEAADAEHAICAGINKQYADILKDVECEELAFDEIARREGKPVKAIYDRYENAKRKAREVGIKLRLSPPHKNCAKAC